MGLETITAKALSLLDNDRYLLATAVAKRAVELNKGSKPLVNLDTKTTKPTDIALHEIASGMLKPTVIK